jgi:hypothetical protein
MNSKGAFLFRRGRKEKKTGECCGAYEADDADRHRNTKDIEGTRVAWTASQESAIKVSTEIVRIEPELHKRHKPPMRLPLAPAIRRAAIPQITTRWVASNRYCGVGKTEVARRLAEFLGSRNR